MSAAPAPEPVDAADREVSLAITRDPSLVRTVRLVAASIARRAGLDASAVEEVRLAVGETCAVLVGPGGDPRDAGAVDSASEEQVLVTLRVEDGLTAEIQGPAVQSVEDPAGDLADLADLAVDPWALLRGVHEDVEVAEDGGSTVVRLAWRA